ADLHFAPTTTAAEQLILAQVNPKSVYVTGNSVVDALLTILNQVKTSAKETHQNYTAGYSKLAVLTTHRRENLGDPQRRILQAVVDLARQHPDLRILWPVHPNPAIRTVLDLFDLPANFQTLPPLSYVDFIPLLNACDLVLTDSGGIQEEAPALGVPVVVLREKTERPEVIDAGYGVLAGSDPEKIRAGAEHFLQQRFSATPATLYGNGTTSEQVLKILIDHFAT
ncbi:MAG: UDP-N-acetyl glucosamine 2-epimerase, partial [Balneolaceae bacterium]